MGSEARIDDDGWSERYNCYSKSYGSLIRLSFATSSTRGEKGYVLRINDSYLEKKPEDVKAAKLFILRNAIAWAEKSLKAMKEDLVKLESNKE